MNAIDTFERPDHRKYRLLREALADVRALVPEDIGPDGRPLAAAAAEATPAPTIAGSSLRLDGVANVAVLCTGVAIVVAAAFAEGFDAPLRFLA